MDIFRRKPFAVIYGTSTHLGNDGRDTSMLDLFCMRANDKASILTSSKDSSTLLNIESASITENIHKVGVLFALRKLIGVARST